MKNNLKLLSALSLLTAGGAAMAADAPTLGSVLESSGITATGYVSGTYVHSSADGQGHQFDATHDSFQLNQAALTLAYQPKEGFGALVNVIGGTDANLLPPFGSGDLVIPQAFVQYTNGTLTVMAGRLLTLAGAEVIAPSGNVNVTRSLLFFSEPLTHTGLRLTVAPSSVFGFTVGVNNGWNYTSLSGVSAKTAELGISVTPSKMFALTAQAYFGKDPVVDDTKQLIDLVATLNVTDSLSFVLSYDNGKQDYPNGTSQKWSGIAGYANIAFSDMVRMSVRAEVFDDKDGLVFSGGDQKVKEATVTVGISPVKSFELRVEGRYDKADNAIFSGDDTQKEIALEALYKF